MVKNGEPASAIKPTRAGLGTKYVIQNLLFRWLFPALLVITTASASAQVTVNQVLFPANIGRTLDATVTIDYTRLNAAAATITTVIPPQLTVDPPTPPAGCVVVAGPALQCDVPAGGAGDSGTISFQVRGNTLGAFSLVPTGTGGSSASNTGTTRSSGELTILKSRSPLGNVLAGSNLTFTLQPQVGAGSDDLPAGTSITVTDQLPGTTGDFTLTGIAPGIASCNSVAAANTSRTVTCSFNGPLSTAALSAATVTLTGQPGTNGSFTNVGSIAADQALYFDRNLGNNIANASYTVDPASDVQAQGSFIATPVLVGSAQSLTITYRNNGPMSLPGGGTVFTTIPAGFTVDGLPAGCVGPAIGVVLGAPAVVTCTVAALTPGSTEGFVIALTMPAASGAGNFPVGVTSPAGFGDAVPGNNTTTVPYQVAGANADLRLAKSKSPASGPIAPGSTITTTLTLTNDGASTSAATFSADGAGTELRVVDYMKPTEIAGDAISNVSAGWTCAVTNNADPTDAARSKRVVCTRSAGGTLAVGASLQVAFSTVVAPVVGQVTLTNRACTGATVLAELGLTPEQGPQPNGSGSAGNDCASAGTNLIATDVGGGPVGSGADISVRKESSNDNASWVDNPLAPPTIVAANERQYWRITITTPAGGGQLTIPTLRLADTLPGILNAGSPGAPAPDQRTPATTVTTSVSAGSATGSCPNLAAGASGLDCSFTSVAPGTTIVVTYAVQRPFAQGTQTNTATLSSPNAVLAGTLSDAAAVTVEPRIDVAATTKTVTPVSPRIGQTAQFTITTQNLGPDDVSSVGFFSVIDDLNTDAAAATVSFGDIAASGTGMACLVANSAVGSEPPLAANHVRVRCTNTTSVPRYNTRSITISARVLKPAALPPAGNVYSNQVNSVRVDIPDSLCEWKTETSTNATVSSACNDAASTSNNTRSVNFDVPVPVVDLQQRKTRVLPAGQSSFGIGQPLRYRFRLQNNGPSRAENVVMNDQLTVPAGFTLSAPQVLNVNGVAADAGYTLDATKTGSVSCTQAGANANLVCVLSTTLAANFLNAAGEVNFEVEFTQTGSALSPVTFSNEAMVCGDETVNYESSGACNRAIGNNNNLASVNDTVFPRADLSITKTTDTAQPVGINQPVQFSLLVRNLGPHATQQIRVQDVLPANFELITSGPNAPSLTLGSFVTQAPSTATAAALACTPVPATITVAGQSQTVTCIVNALPGPLGAGAFPGSADAANTVTLRLFARAKEGFFSGPYLTDRSNGAAVTVGLDGAGNPLALDLVPGNNSGGSVVQVGNASIAGRVFNDRNNNGVQDGTLAAQDEGIGNVTITLTGTDAYGNAITRTATTDNTVGATRGSYLFDNLPPGTYRVDETQPAAYTNSPAATPTIGPDAPSAGGTYASGGAAGNSSHAGVVLAAGSAAVNYHFPEVRRPALSGFIYIDLNNSGVRDGADTPVTNATVRLLNAATGAVVQTTTTDGTGAYSFNALDPFLSYAIEEPLPTTPAGLGNGPVNAGLIGGAACAAGCTTQSGYTGTTDRITAISLSSGLDGSGFNFGETIIGLISGTVYVDRNRNNALDGLPTDGRLGGVTINLYAGAGCAGPVLASTSTDTNGNYYFPNRLAGQTFTVCESQPAGYGDGATHPGTDASSPGVNTITITNLAPGGSFNNNFGEVGASLAGYVYLDANNDGLRAGEIGAPGVTITLSGQDPAGSPVHRSTVTDVNGGWRFDDLPAANGAGYTVTEQLAQPAIAGAPTVDGKTTAGSLGGIATALGTLPSAISAIPLPVGGSSVENNFGETRPPSPIGASIAGVVYLDLDRDGLMDGVPTDGRLVGVTITLRAGNNCSGALVASTVTDTNGAYQFAGVETGKAYVVCQAQPLAYADGRTNPGNDASSDTPNTIRIGVLPAGGSANNNFGEWPGSISGHVYLDANNDGARAGEPGLPGVLVSLGGKDIDGNTVQRNTTTDDKGAWKFDGLPAAGAQGYTITEQAEQPRFGNGPTINGRTTPGSSGGTATAVSTTPSAIGAVVLPAGAASVENNFGERAATGSISGQVWLDDNNNGRIDASEHGIAGVPITLSGIDDAGKPVNRNVVTDADGRYRFDDLAPGTYVVTQPTQPGGTTDGVTNPGTIDGVAVGTPTPPGSTPSAVTAIDLPAGRDMIHNDFGEVVLAPGLVVTKAADATAFVVGHAGGYTLRVRNVGQAGTAGSYTVTDRLPRGITLAATPIGSGWSCSGAVGATNFSCTSSAVLAPQGSAPAIKAAVRVTASAAGASAVNAVMVEGGGEPEARKPTQVERDAVNGDATTLPTCTGEATQNACRTDTAVQLPAALSGTVWFDQGVKAQLLDDGDKRLPGWEIELIDPATGQVVANTVSGTDGAYRITDLLPGVPYVVRFRDPDSGVVYGYPVNGETAPGSSGATCSPDTVPSSCVDRSSNPQLAVVLAPGQELTQQSLPVDPSGVVYDSQTRQPVAGAIVSLTPVGVCPLWSPATHVAGATLGGYRINGASIAMTTGSDGMYQYLLLPTAPAVCEFRLDVVPPPSHGFVSTLIPPAVGALRPSGPVGTDFSVQPLATAPTGPVGTATQYFLTLIVGSATPGVVHNHIPVDPSVPAGLLLRKTGDRQIVELGDTVRYSISVASTGGVVPRHVTVVDRLPAGFSYVAGTASVDGRRIADPAGSPAPRLAFEAGPMPSSGSFTLTYRARVGVGSQQGDGVNRAVAHACNTGTSCVDPGGFGALPRSSTSNEGVYQVRVVGGVFTTDACVLGKVFVDCNGNQLQDAEELGIPGVRLVLQDGTTLISDSEGKYSICDLQPRSHVMRIDPLTLPRGSRLVTSSNRNLGDAGSLWLDLKFGELHRADFIEGSCSNTVLEQVKARRAQGEVRAPETERSGQQPLRFDSKAHGLDAHISPQQGTDSANQLVPRARQVGPAPDDKAPLQDEQDLPAGELPMNQPPPTGQSPADAPDAAAKELRNATR